MSHLFLGLDVGTQATKGLLIDAESHSVVARASAPHEFVGGLPDGAVEQHPHTWIDAVCQVAQRLLASDGVHPGAVGGVGVSGQQHGLVLLDERGRVVRPAKLWCDTSTAAEARELSQRLGRPIPAGFTASKVLWMARHEPQAWDRVHQILLPHDYVNVRLTGSATTDPGDASGTGFFDLWMRQFDLEAAAGVDPRLPLTLPALVEPGEPAGFLDHDGAKLLGLPAGIPVAAGSGDNMCSAVGAGATCPGVVAVSLGTSATAFTVCAEPIEDRDGLLAAFCDAAGGWLSLLCLMNCTGVTEEVRAAFGQPDLAALTRAAGDVPPGCHGLLWIPYLQGERVPDLPRATGALTGMRPGLLRPATLFRAAMEGVSLGLGWGLERMRLAGVPLDEVRLVGGAAANPLWRRILADVSGLPVVRLLETESAALGAALLALWTARRCQGWRGGVQELAAPFVHLARGREEPDAQRGAVYERVSRRFRGLVGQLYSSDRPA